MGGDLFSTFFTYKGAIMDETLQVVLQTSKIWSTGDIVALIVAGVSFLGTIIVGVITNKVTKKISDENINFQRQMTKKNIDANLISNARIKWVQDVRSATAELLALCHEFINEIDKEELFPLVVRIQEAIELLILYFGHEDMDEKQGVDLKCKENNINKNSAIVFFLLNLSKKINKYYLIIKSGRDVELKEIREKNLIGVHEYVVGFEINDIEIENGEVYQVEEPIFDPKYQERLDRTDREIKDIARSLDDIINDISELRDIIRTYLKIEWNKAKNGEEEYECGFNIAKNNCK